MDNILVHGETQVQHDEHLEIVLHQRSWLTLNSEKCKFSRTNGWFLNHVIDAKGIHPDPNKVKAITQVETPKSITEICQFLGMLNKTIKFAPNMADTTKPLHNLLSTKNQWTLEVGSKGSFQKGFV